MIVTTTPRLVIREFTSRDPEFIVRLLNTPQWLQYIGDRKVKTKKDALKYLENGPIKSYHEHGFGLYLVALRDENISIGMCGLIKRDALEDVDIGFAFLPEFYGKGYAYESAISVVNHARSLGLKRVVAITLPDNESSIRLLKKINMNFEKMFQLPNDEKELMLFSINIA